MQCLRHTYAKQVYHGLSKIYIWLWGKLLCLLFLLDAQSVTPRHAEQYIDSHCWQCSHPHSVLDLWNAWGEWAELDRLQPSHQEREDSPAPISTTGSSHNVLFHLLLHSVSWSISPVAHRSHGHTAMRPSSSNKRRNWGPEKQSVLNKVTEPGGGIAWFYDHHSSSSLPLWWLTSTYWVLIMYQALCSENTFIISYFNSWDHSLK